MPATGLRVGEGSLTGSSTIHLVVELVGLPPPTRPGESPGEIVTIFANGEQVFQDWVYTRSPVVTLYNLQPGSYRFHTSSMSPDRSTALVTILPRLDGGEGSDRLESPHAGYALFGHEGNDTLAASAGTDLLEGGPGADVFSWAREPWSPTVVRDFTVGTDRLDLSALFRAAGYAGLDPVGDGRIVLLAGDDATLVLFDDDGPAGDWPNYIIKLQGVAHGGLTWAQLGGAGSSDPAPPGRELHSPAPGSTLVGGSGADTLHASQGPDLLTGGGGDDTFVYAGLPWSAGSITDFAIAADRLDLSGIFEAAGYRGSDPVAEGRMRFDSDGAGGTRLYFDHDALDGGDWPFLITTLRNVSPAGLSWSQLSAQAAPPPASRGGVLTWRHHGDTLTGGSGADTLNASQGPDQLTGGGGSDHFAWAQLPWRAGRVTDFTPGSDKLDLRLLFRASGYTGADPVAEGRLEFRDDGAGGAAVYFDRDLTGGGDWPFLITTLERVRPDQIGAGDWLFQ